ncbi:putative ribosomal protein L34e [Paratrimastix pyriformis]|uniref:Ribosomal protein L34e n=1 Tax=Paratrimastix pyriformis TaxID=342808 RepID=A0ABQ8USI9_9EUKA|nr:putative ribosomal protein L34e [Paratrimastix pyriformis]
MVQRLTFRRNHSYCTRNNRVRVVKTPGGKNVYQYVKKTSTGVKCGDCHCTLQGIPQLVRNEAQRCSHTEKSVSRAYGGSRCAKCVRDRIIRAFLIEEQKIVKKIAKEASKKVVVAKKD